jgi:hypothetical protein
MPIDLAWKNEDHDIILRTYHGRWTEDDLNAAEANINAMIDSVGHRVDVITDIRNSNSFPPNVSGLFESYEARRHQRIALIVAVGREINLDLMLLLAEKYPDFPRHYAFAKSIDDAMEIITADCTDTRFATFLPSSDNPA